MTLFALFQGNRVEINTDGSLVSPLSYWDADILASIAAAPREEVPDPEPIVSTPEPDWDGFLTPFYAPGVGGIYDSIATLVQASTPKTQEHWANARIGLINPIVRTPQWLYSSWEYLKFLLSEDGNPLSAQTIADCEALMNQYHLLP